MEETYRIEKNVRGEILRCAQDDNTFLFGGI